MQNPAELLLIRTKAIAYKDVLNAKNALGQEARRYDSKEGIGRVESGTETENNAGVIIEEQLPRRKKNHQSSLKPISCTSVCGQLIFLGFIINVTIG